MRSYYKIIFIILAVILIFSVLVMRTVDNPLELGIIFIALGIFLLFFEIIEPGFGIFGFLGIVSLVFGIFILEREPSLQTGYFHGVTTLVLGVLAGLLILFIIITRGVSKIFGSKPKTGPEALIGLEAEVIEGLNPAGRVRVRQETWLAESLERKNIPERAKVKIIKVEGSTLFVKEQ